MPSKPGERERRPLKWTDPQKRALNLIFEGRKSQAKIAEDCGIPVRTLEDWIAHPDFQQKLTERRENLIASLDHKPYIRKERRLAGLADMAERARMQFEARPWLQEIRPLPQKAAVRIRHRVVDADPLSGDGSADASTAASEPSEEVTEPLDAIVNESFNEAAFNAFRGALDDIAKELGQRTNKVDVTSNGETMRTVFVLPQIVSDADDAADISPDNAPEDTASTSHSG